MSDHQFTASTTDSAGVGSATNAGRVWIHGVFVVAVVVQLLVHAPTYRSLMETWARTGTFEFAFLIFPICIVLVWSLRKWVAAAPFEPRAWASALVFGIGVFWLAGVLVDINLAQHIAMVVIWPVLVYVVYGPSVARVLTFPLAYMLFAIPFGNFMVGPLQTVTAHLAVAAIGLTDVPVLMSGHYIDTPAAAWHVAEACSGVKFFVATSAFGVLYAYLFFRSLSRRLIFIACAMVVPVIANGLRVFFTILIGEHFGLEYATGTDHAVFGWQFFGLVLVLLFFAGWPWHEPTPRPPETGYDGPTDTSARERLKMPALLALAILVPAAGLYGFRALAGTELAVHDSPTAKTSWQRKATPSPRLLADAQHAISGHSATHERRAAFTLKHERPNHVHHPILMSGVSAEAGFRPGQS